jgi:hypothetical protein
LVGFKIACFLQNTTHLLFIVGDNLISGIPTTKYSRSVGLSFFREVPVLFDTVDIVSGVGRCALGKNIALVTLFQLFVVMIAYVFETNCWF